MEGIKKGLEEEEFVEVLHNYSYQRNNDTFCMTKGEILMLLKRSNDDWWQVIRQGEKKSFFAPSNCVRVYKVPTEQMKQTIRQDQYISKGNISQSSDDIVPTGRPQGLALPSRDNILHKVDRHSPSQPMASQSYVTKINPNRTQGERTECTDMYPSRSTSTSSFKGESPLVPTKRFHSSNPRNESSESSGIYSRGFSHQVSQESSSSHTSRSSLNDGSRCSTESLTHSLNKTRVIKAASHDELSSGGHCRSSLDISQPRAASSEELDCRYSGRDYLFRSNQLSYRHRSNSVDLRIFQKDLSISELKQGSLDKMRKPRLTKDPNNRRKSWAVEESRVPDHHRTSLRRGDTKDVSIVLDVPPKLPPKKSKNRLTDKFSSSTESVGKLEGPIDIKVQEIKANKPQPPLTAPNVKRLSHDFERGSTRLDSGNVDIPETQRGLLRGNQDDQELKEVPVALPRKMIPHQPSTFVGKSEVMKSQSGGNIYMTQSASQMVRDNNGNQVKIENKEGKPDLVAGDFSTFQEKILYEAEGRQIRKSESAGRIPRTPDLMRKIDRTPDPLRKVYGSQDASRGRNYTDEAKKSFFDMDEAKKAFFNTDEAKKAFFNTDEAKKSFFNMDEAKRAFFNTDEAKKSFFKDDEKENDRFPIRDTPTPDSGRVGKMHMYPPSPKVNPQRIVFDNWGEYYDETTKRPFFYNSKTREKRWKPPRKGIHSVSIPEVPPFDRGDRPDFGGRSQPRSPPPDYPSSPKIPHRALYNHLEGGLALPSNKSSTLGNSQSRSSHHPDASSRTLPAVTSNSPHKGGYHPQLGQSVSLLTTPPTPPSSAKPSHVPAIPTTPSSPHFPEFCEDDQNSDLLDALDKIIPPKGWEKKRDKETQRVLYFYNMATGEKWFATTTEEGKIYYYDVSGSKRQWKLPEQNDAGDESTDTLNRPTSPESLRISQISENLNELCKNTEKEGFLHRTFLMREGKKCRKNWTNSYVRYVVGQFESNISGFLYFSKSKDEDKKAEVFEFHDLVYLERTNDKKTSRQQVLGLRNGRDTEVLLQFDDKDIADAWFTALSKHDGMQLNIIQEKEDKKGKKGSEKVKRESSLDNLTPDNKGITDKLLNFIKKRPLRETLEKKGIYKESVFGSTLAELASQDKTLTPIFVLQCIKNIERNEENLRTDGLYRISGNAALIQKIRFEIAQRNYAALSREKDVHNLSGSLKLFFRELKEPLIPFANYDDFIQASEYDRRNSQQVEKLAKAVKKLPPENFETLKVLLRHLLRVTEYESDNRMSVSNLAIVFGPCLLWPKVTTNSDLMTDVMLHNRVIEGLLSDFNKIFQFKR